jgi:predicted dienelactone hydrolase
MHRLVSLLLVAAAELAAQSAFAADFGARAMPGGERFRVATTEWRDAGRDRVVPLKIYAPDGNGPFPVLLFSHGLGGSRDAGAEWAEHWASHGYLVLALQHPGSDASLWRGAATPADAARGMRSGMTAEQYVLRVEDVRFVIDELARRRDARDPVAAKADLRRIGMSGHSFGAQTTQAVAGERFSVPAKLADPRVRAAIAFSPSARGAEAALGERFGGISIPFLSITGTRDGDVAGTGATPDNRTRPFRYMQPPDKYLLVLAGADHMVFNGQPGLRREPSAEEAAQGDAVKAATLAFWDAYLKDDARAKTWLANGGFAKALGGAGEFSAK